MNKEFLINSVSKLLGVSSSEKEFAFQIFLEKTAEVLERNEALKYPDLGFFYFKENDEDKHEFVESLLFVPIQDGTEILEENFFLSFEVKRRNKNAMDFDPSVFSLSIDKTTLPFERDAGHNSDISYHLLKKTIEERVEELIGSATRLENFKILDALFTENSIKDEFVSSQERDILEIEHDSSYEEMIFSRMNFDEVGDASQSVEFKTEDKPIGSDNDSSFETVEKYESTFDQLHKEDEEMKTNALRGNKILETGLSDSADLDSPDFKDKRDDIEWVLTDKKLSAETEKRISEPLGLHAYDKHNGYEEGIDLTVEKGDDPFGELEKTFEEKIKENDIPKGDEIPANFENEVSIIQQESIIEKGEQKMTENKDNTPTEEYNPYPEDDSNQKRNILLVCALVVIVLVAVYIIFFNGFGLMKKSTPALQPAKTDQIQNQSADKADSLKSTDVASQQPVTGSKTPVQGMKSDIRENPKVNDKSQKLKESAAGDLLREMKNDSKVGSNIFTDGTKFYVQISSWKNIEKASTEAKKLKAKGLDAFVVKAYIEQFKGTWYRVRVGSFKTKEEAEAFSSKNR